MTMTSSKPYLIRAIYEWINDNELTPYIVFNAEMPGVQVPEEFIEDGRIVLNISAQACRGLHLENDRIIFSARFSGRAMQIFAPPKAVLAIYAKENGRGMMFDEDFDDGSEGEDEIFEPATVVAPAKSDEPKNKSKSKAKLKVVK